MFTAMSKFKSTSSAIIFNFIFKSASRISSVLLFTKFFINTIFIFIIIILYIITIYNIYIITIFYTIFLLITILSMYAFPYVLYMLRPPRSKKLFTGGRKTVILLDMLFYQFSRET
jgi:hypothetical protein